MANDNNDEVDVSEVKELMENDSSRSQLHLLIGVFIAFALVNIGHSIWSVIDFVSDDSIPLVVCPRSYELDSPVLLPKINDTGSDLVQDRWIRGFVRKFVNSAFPRTKEDVESGFKFARDHSMGDVNYKYRKYYSDVQPISDTVGKDSYLVFYPKSSKEITIRKETATKWIVTINGYFVRFIDAQNQDRYVSTLKYTVEAGKSTKNNPEGLYITDANITELADVTIGVNNPDNNRKVFQ